MTSMASPSKFFDALRVGILGPTLEPNEVSGCEAIIASFKGFPLAHVAYALGTAFLETGGTMQPIKEWGGPKYFTKMYDIQGSRPNKARELGNLAPGDGARYCGRGYPQVTGKRNYALAEALFHVPFIAHPDLMLVAGNAGPVMAHFMKHGLFTGRKLADYLSRPGPALRSEFKQARRIINGTDRADEIAGFALSFQDALMAGGWA